MKLNTRIMKGSIDKTEHVDGGKKVTLYSEAALKALKYFELTIPKFSKGIASAEILTDEIKLIYPVEWAAVESKVSERAGAGKNIFPDLGRVNAQALIEAEEETRTRDGRLVTVYDPRVATIMRYLSATVPRFVVSKEAATLLESGLKKRYPNLF